MFENLNFPITYIDKNFCMNLPLNKNDPSINS
jgi:hypothetical protein